MKSKPIKLDGSSLDIDALSAIAFGCELQIEQSSLDRMQRTNLLIHEAANTGKLVYGVTTALGPQLGTVLNADQINEFALKTVRGRAHSVGAPLDRHLVRAAMAVRLNSLLIGASGASPAVAKHLLDCLNADLVPVVGETASVGAADLLWGGSMALALVGEGRFLGHDKSSASCMADAGLSPLVLGPRDGLALVSHSSFSAALASMGVQAVDRLWNNAQIAAALTLEGFRGNLSPLDADVLAKRSQPGQAESAQHLGQLLQGSELNDLTQARRLQDPLSIRNIVQVHGSVYASLKLLEATLLDEINGASDNPVVLLERREIISGGGYLNPHLGTLLVAINHALVQLAALAVSRTSRMMSSRFTELSIGLHASSSGSVGLGAVTKVTEALFAEIAQLATPAPVYPPAQADSVEDCITHSAISAKALLQITEKMNVITAFEMIAAVHAIYLRSVEDKVAPALQATVATVRSLSPALSEDRSITAELEQLAAMLDRGEL